MNFVKKTILTILIIGIFLRIFLSATTYHSDVAPFDFAGRVLSETKISNFYDYLWSLPDGDRILTVYPRNLFNYPPLPYFFLGGISRLTTILINSEVYNNFLYNFTSTLGNPELNLLLFLLKLPYFFFDIAIGFLLMKFFSDRKQKIWIFGLWIFNPVNLYATYMLGQFDIIPTFFTVLSLYFAPANLILSAIMIGLGAGFKIYPILFLFPLALIKQDWWGRIKIITIGFITYIISTYPFIFSEGFRKTALLAGQTTKSLYAQIPISGGESIILFLAVIIFIYLKFFYHKLQAWSLWRNFFILLLVFFALTHYHPQWFLWIMPFFIIDLVASKFKHWPLFTLVLVSFVVLLTFFDPGLTIWLFAPINPTLYGLPGFWQLIGINPDIILLRSVFQTIFVGTAIYYIYENK